jgi:outer membrane immunogenic protein
MMNKYLATTAAVVALGAGFTAAASAADLGTPAPVYTKAPPPVWSWSGFYVGADVGASWSNDNVSPTVADDGTFPRTNTLRDSGWLGGGTVGYNFQTGHYVFGVESDLGYLQAGQSKADALGGTEIDSLASSFYADVTGRLGYAVDNVLFYGKGGWAYYDGKATTTTQLAGFTWANSGAFNGWTAGGGIEYKYTQALSFKVEYQHFDFGSSTATITGAAGVFPYKNDLTADTLKLGVNYRLW